MDTKESSGVNTDLKELIELLRREGVRQFRRGDLEIVFESAREQPARFITATQPGVTVVRPNTF